MKKKRFYFVLPLVSVLLLLLSNCVALSPTTLSPQGKNEKLLPPLTPVLDAQSFGSVFPIEMTAGMSSSGGVNVPVVTTGVSVSTKSGGHSSYSFTGWQLNEISVMFNRDVENNISVPLYTGEAKGAIMVKLATGETNILGSSFWMPVLSGLTLCIFNLFGAPVDMLTTGFQIEVTIHNSKGDVVGKYISDYHKETTFAALYWGYSLGNMPKRSLRIAFEACMQDIKRHIANDYDRLIAALNAE